MDEIEELYEKITSNDDWEIDNLDKLLTLVRAEGYKCGMLNAKRSNNCHEAMMI